MFVYVVLCVAVLAIIAFLVVVSLYLNERAKSEVAVTRALVDAEAGFREREKAARADAIRRHDAVLSGLVAERAAPFLEAFPYNLEDAWPLKGPVDFVVFEGLSTGDLTRVVLLEVKGGKGKLSGRQRQVRRVVEEGGVGFEVMRIGG